MARQPTRMRHVKEILLLKLQNELSVSEMARSCGIPASTVGDYIQRAEAAGSEPSEKGNGFFHMTPSRTGKAFVTQGSSQILSTKRGRQRAVVPMGAWLVKRHGTA